jgi:hypothetical protein
MMDEATDRSLERTARLRAVSMKITAATTVTLLRKVVAPRLPKRVWLDPPKAAPISAPLPDWSKITPTMTKQARRCITINRVYIRIS